MCVHIPMCASYLSNIMFNYFKVTVLIETAYVFGGVFFPLGRITKAKEVWFFLWFGFLHSTFILLFNWITRGLLILLQLRKMKPGSLKKSQDTTKLPDSQ